MHTFMRVIEDNLPHCFFWQLVKGLEYNLTSTIGDAIMKIERLGYRVEYVDGNPYLFAGNTGRIVAYYEWSN